MESLSPWGLKLSTYLSAETIRTMIRVAVLLFIGLPAIYYFSKWIRKVTTLRLSAQPGMVAGKIIYYTGLFMILFSVLNELGFHLNTLLGAAGIVGIAVGFASQTSVSNIISGIFIMMERPFVINDYITVDGMSGQVLSIDMLSIKLKTDDNRFVRIPNETVIKNRLTNATRFPIRRLDIHLGIGYREDIARVRAALMDVAKNNPLCLQEPAPQVILSGFGQSSIDFLFAVWATQANLLALQNSIQEDLKIRFDQEGIEIPFPYLSLYSGRNAEPFPVRIIEKNEG